MPGPYFPGYVTKGDFNKISATAEHELGAWGYAGSGKILQYVKFGALESLKPFNWVGVDLSATGADAAHTVGMLRNSATHAPVGVAEYGGTAGSYGWITRYGPATGKVGTGGSQGQNLLNDAGATGILGNLGSLTSATTSLLAAAKCAGVCVGSASVTGTYVNVNCL